MQNNWTPKVVERLSSDWKRKGQPGTEETFYIAAKSGVSFLDIGCGFGRFYDYLLTVKKTFYYVGYDSSTAMIDKAKKLHPVSECFFLKNITIPFIHTAETVFCHEIFIHLLPKEQEVILQNVKAIKPKTFIVTIQSNKKRETVIEYPKLEDISFRNVIQDEKDFEELLLCIFDNAKLEKFEYRLTKGVYKVVFVVESML